MPISSWTCLFFNICIGKSRSYMVITSKKVRKQVKKWRKKATFWLFFGHTDCFMAPGLQKHEYLLEICLEVTKMTPIKGILHQKNFYRLNLIFWIVMGCGIIRFGRRGLKTTETWKFWSQNLSPGVLRRGAPGVSRHSTMGFRGAAQGFRGTALWGFEGQHHGHPLTSVS